MFEHILIAVDGSDYSRQALPTAVEIARKFGSGVFILHVHEHDVGRAATLPLESPIEASKLVADAVRIVRDAGVEASGEVHNIRLGHVGDAIVDAAKDKHIDLIVMGSRGLSDIESLLLGSVAHKVMQTANVPVLIDRRMARTAPVGAAG